MKNCIIVGNIGKCFFCGVQRLAVTGQDHTVDIITVGDKTVNVVSNVRILRKLFTGGTAGKNLLDFAVEDHILGQGLCIINNMCYVTADFFRSGCLGIDDGLAVAQSQHNNGNGTDDGSDRSGDPKNGQQQPVPETLIISFMYVW